MPQSIESIIKTTIWTKRMTASSAMEKIKVHDIINASTWTKRQFINKNNENDTSQNAHAGRMFESDRLAQL